MSRTSRGRRGFGGVPAGARVGTLSGGGFMTLRGGGLNTDGDTRGLRLRIDTYRGAHIDAVTMTTILREQYRHDAIRYASHSANAPALLATSIQPLQTYIDDTRLLV